MSNLSIVPNQEPIIPEPPQGLREKGTHLWNEMHSMFDFSNDPDKLSILEQACRVEDTIKALSDDFEERGCSYTATGSAKQMIIHPLIAEIRTQRVTLSGLLKSLKLPAEQQESLPPVKTKTGSSIDSSRWRK